MIQDHLEFSCSLRAVLRFEISLAAKILRPEVAVDFIFARRLEQLNGLRPIATIQLRLSADDGKPVRINQRFGWKFLGQFINQRLSPTRFTASSISVRGANHICLFTRELQSLLR